MRSGDPRSLSRAISMVENRSSGCSDLLKALFPHTGKALVIGITGAPGAGKSTLVDRLATVYRARGERVGIIAVDPSSPFHFITANPARVSLFPAGAVPATHSSCAATSELLSIDGWSWPCTTLSTLRCRSLPATYQGASPASA